MSFRTVCGGIADPALVQKIFEEYKHGNRKGILPSDYDFDAHKELVAMQPGDVPVTYADATPLERDFGFKTDTSLRDGLRRFAEWHRIFYQN